MNRFNQVIHHIKQNPRPAIICVCLIVFLDLMYNVTRNSLPAIDLIMYRFAVQTIRIWWLTPIMESLSMLASPLVLLVILIIIGAFAPGKKPVQCCFVNLISVVVLNQLFKFIIQRPRPYGYNLITEIGYSFPSGHSMVAVGFFGLLAWLVFKTNISKKEKYCYAGSLAFIALAIGFSRIYLGVHYASDVIGGTCLALAWLAFYTKTIAPIFLPQLTINSR